MNSGFFVKTNADNFFDNSQTTSKGKDNSQSLFGDNSVFKTSPAASPFNFGSSTVATKLGSTLTNQPANSFNIFASKNQEKDKTSSIFDIKPIFNTKPVSFGLNNSSATTTTLGNTVTSMPAPSFSIFAQTGQEKNKPSSIFNTASAPFSFNNPATAATGLTNNSTSNIFGQPCTTNNTINTSNTGVNTEHYIKSQLLEIEKIIEAISQTTDTKSIDDLKFQLNYKIEYLSKNINKFENNFFILYILSQYLKTVDTSLLDNVFFLNIQTNLSEFTKLMNSDWLSTNIFSVALAVKKALENFTENNVQCVVAEDYSNNNRVALMFFIKGIKTGYHYYIGDFPTKEFFLISINFDIECLKIKKLWEAKNPDYCCNISSKYALDKIENSYLYATICNNNQVLVGTQLNLDGLFDISDTGIPLANIKNWFQILDKITAVDYVASNRNFDYLITESTALKYNGQKPSYKNNFYDTLVFALQY